MGNGIWASVSVPGSLANPGARYICCCDQASSTGNSGDHRLCERRSVELAATQPNALNEI